MANDQYKHPAPATIFIFSWMEISLAYKKNKIQTDIPYQSSRSFQEALRLIFVASLSPDINLHLVGLRVALNINLKWLLLMMM